MDIATQGVLAITVSDFHRAWHACINRYTSKHVRRNKFITNGVNIINLVHTVNPEEIRTFWDFEGGLGGGGGGMVVGGGCFKNASRNW